MTPAFVALTLAGRANTHNEANLLFDGREIPEWQGEADEPPLPGSVVALQVLAGGHHVLDGAVLVVRLAHERLNVHDRLALPERELHAVGGAGRIDHGLRLLTAWQRGA